MKINHKLMILSIIPLAAVIVLSLMVIGEYRQDVSAAQNAKGIEQLLQPVTKLFNALQMERGSGGGHISSPDDQYRVLFAKTMTATNEAIAELESRADNDLCQIATQCDECARKTRRTSSSSASCVRTRH